MENAEKLENGPLISVIIPVYRVEEYLQKCLDSVFCNTYRNLEIICVNDGSPDRCPEILRAQTDPRVIVIDQENSGVAAARNTGLSSAHGEYIAFVDSDDWIHPQYFEVLLDAITKRNAAVAICEYTKFSANDTVDVRRCPEHEIRDLGVKAVYHSQNYPCYVWGRIYRASELRGVRFDSNTALEDVIFNAGFFAGLKTFNVCCVDLPLYYYLQRADSLMSAGTKWDFLKISRRLCQIAGDCASTDVARELYLRCMRRGLYIRYAYKGNPERRKQYEDSFPMIRETYRILKDKRLLGSRERIMYGLCAACPPVYHIYRKLKEADSEPARQ